MTEREGSGERQEAAASGSRLARAASTGAPSRSGSRPGSSLPLARQPSAGGATSPKRVSFALQPQPLGSPAGAGSPSRRRLARSPQPAAASAALRLITAADHSLVFIPEVDSPGRKPLAPLATPFRRAPSNQALCASDSEIAATVDMSDLPPGVHTPRRSDSLARALFSLLPGQASVGDSPESSPKASQEMAAAAGTAAAGTPAAAQPGQQAARAGSGGVTTPPPTPRSGALSPTPAAAAAATSGLGFRLASLLGRLLDAAGTSGSSIAELAATSSGAAVLSGPSRPSMDSSYASVASGSSSDLFGSACSEAHGANSVGEE
ncbi:hypothetical protein ABPG75_010608 [Micractinium tetrahymenae]